MKSIENSRHQKQVFAEIILGSPRARCARFGICEARLLDLEAWQSFKPRTARTAKALLVSDSPGSLRFVFPAEDMLQLTFEYFFGTGFFRVDVSTQLSTQLLEPLGLESFVVKKGLYPCRIQAGSAIVLKVVHDFNCVHENSYEVAGEALG